MLLRRLRGLHFLLLFATLAAHTVNGQFGFEPGRQEQPLFNGQVQVPPGRQWSYSFSTRTNFVNGRIAGNVQASGGSGDDIRVLVTRGPSVIYDSGRRRSVVLSVDISEPGQYSLIFDNGFSLVSGKVVGGRISLVHWGVDTEKNVADQQTTAARHSQGISILQRLYTTLKANERVWGTTQLFAFPTFRVSPERSINAGANWAVNLIQVNKGTFDFAETTGNKEDDVLAAILAHELGHIFYRHPSYGSGSGVKGFFDELRGVTELDRAQEQEADILGIRIACQANFDPDGMLQVMLKFAEINGTANSFMRNHPTGVERFGYLQREAATCRAQQKREQRYPSTVTGNRTDEAAQGIENISGDGLWKLVQSPNVLWRFKVGDQFLYGERALSDEQTKLGDYDTVDVKRQGDGFRGTQRVRATLKINDSSPQGFRYRTCQWDFDVDLTSVTEERIEGRWEGYGRNPKLNANSCVYSGQRIWEDVTWIRK